MKLRPERLPWAAMGALFVLAGLFAISRVLRHEAPATVDDAFHVLMCLIVGTAMVAEALGFSAMGEHEATRDRFLRLALGFNGVAGLNVVPDPWDSMAFWTGAACLLMYVVNRWRRRSPPESQSAAP